MAILKNTVYNMTAINKRIATSKQARKTNLHLFAKGVYSLLTKEQIRDIKYILKNDYRVAMDILNEAEKVAPKQLTK